jgi:hypothetical protein
MIAKTKINSKIYKIAPKTYLMVYKSYFEMGMSFLRLQEYYESASKKYKGKHFDIFEFMRHYTKKNKLTYFSYTDDFAGYNLPSSVVDAHRNVKDRNLFEKDLFMHLNKIKDKNFYLIGSLEGKTRTLKHEVAHSLYYHKKDYRDEMLAIIKKIKPNKIKKLYKALTKMGYDKSVFDDELQAYFSTGLILELEKVKGIKESVEKCKKVFKKYYVDVKNYKKVKL